MDHADVGGVTDGSATPAYHGQGLGLPQSGAGSMATTGRRVVALFIDWFAALIVARALVGTPENTVESFATLGVFALEVALLTWLWGSSFGQRLVGLRVVGRSRRLGLIGSMLRTVLICLVIPPLVWDSDGRGLHDRAVNTVVVRS